MKMQFRICEICGNIFGIVNESGVPVYCCGQEMSELAANTVDAATEKHVPQIERKGNKIIIRAGEKETMTVEGMIKIVYDLLKDKLNIVKLTFTSGDNAASCEYESVKSVDRCPLCGIALNEKGICTKCGYKK